MNNTKYQENLKKVMNILAKEGYIFIGQTIIWGGSPMYNSLIDVSKEQKIEFPVAENTQLGVSQGMSLEGIKVCSIFPRIDFLISAMDSLINHVDKVSEMSKREFNTGIIIRTQLGNTKPLYPGCQHCGDYTQGLKKMLKNITISRPKTPEDVILVYKLALHEAKRGKSTLIIESPSGVWKA